MADEMTPEQPQQSPTGLSQAYLESVMARKEEAERQMQKLMDALNVRKNMPFDPVLMRVAGALLQPTKTGSFGESLGYATTAAAEEGEKQAMRGIDLAKLEFELGQKKLEQQKAMDALKLRQQFFGGKPAAPTAPAAAPVAAQPLTEVPQASTPAAPAVLPEAAPPAAAPAAAPVGFQRRMPTGMDALLMMESDPELYKLLSEEDKRALEEAKLGLQQREVESKERVTIESGGVKVSVPKIDADRMSNAIEKKDYKTAQRLYEKYALPFPFVKEGENYRLKTPAEAAEEIEVAKGIETKPYFIPEVGGTVAMLPRDFKAYREAVKENKGEEWVDKNLRRKPVGGEPTKAEAKPFLTEEERVAEQKRRERIAEEKAKSEVKSRDEIISNAKTAMVIEKPATQIFKIASDPVKSKALGLLENPDVFSAVAGVTADGVQIGPFRMGIPAVREAVAKVTGDPKEREQILNALQMLSRNYSEIELNFTRLYLKGEGAVTEGERAIVRQVSGGVGNRRTVALAQTETLLQRAAFDKAVKTELLRWEKANPNKSIDEFTESAGYKKLYSDLERNTDAIYDKYFGGKKEPKAAEPKAAPTSAAPSTAPAGSLRQQIDAAKKARGLQ
jgi:hypothetical protein